MREPAAETKAALAVLSRLDAAANQARGSIAAHQLLPVELIGDVAGRRGPVPRLLSAIVIARRIRVRVPIGTRPVIGIPVGDETAKAVGITATVHCRRNPPGRRAEDGCQRRLRRVPARGTRSPRPRHDAAHVRQDRRVLRRGDVRDGDGQHALPAGR